MTPAPETLLLTLDVELGQKSSLKCKQLWHFITKFTIVFQNTPYYKLQGHSHLPPVTVSAPGGASSVTLVLEKGDVETAGVSASEVAPSFTVWQWGFIRGNPEWDFHIALLNRTKKGQMLLLGQMALPHPSRLSKSHMGGPTWVWGMGRDRKEAWVPLNALAGADLIQTWGPRLRAGHCMVGYSPPVTGHVPCELPTLLACGVTRSRLLPALSARASG